MDEVRKEKQAVMDQIKQIDEKLKDIDNEIALLEEKLKSATEKKDLAYETLNALRRRRDEVVGTFYSLQLCNIVSMSCVYHHTCLDVTKDLEFVGCNLLVMGVLGWN